MKQISLTFLVLLTACASSTGVVSTGPNTYMVVGTAGSFGSNSADKVAADLYREASAYCAEQKKEMMRVTVGGRDGNFGRLASSKLEFKCVEKANATIDQPTK